MLNLTTNNTVLDLGVIETHQHSSESLITLLIVTISSSLCLCVEGVHVNVSSHYPFIENSVIGNGELENASRDSIRIVTLLLISVDEVIELLCAVIFTVSSRNFGRNAVTSTLFVRNTSMVSRGATRSLQTDTTGVGVDF